MATDETGRVIDDSPEEIWLAPSCHATWSDGRQWRPEDVWGTCKECGAPAVKYVRADLAGKWWRF